MSLPSAKSLTLEFHSFSKSLIYIRKRSELSMKPPGTPAKTNLHDEHFSFKKILLNIPDRQFPRSS